VPGTILPPYSYSRERHLVVVRDDELDALRIDPASVRSELDLGGGVGDALQADVEGAALFPELIRFSPTLGLDSPTVWATASGSLEGRAP